MFKLIKVKIIENITFEKKRKDLANFLMLEYGYDKCSSYNVAKTILNNKYKILDNII